MTRWPATDAVVHGDCDAAFEGVRDAFAAQLRRRARAGRLAVRRGRRPSRRRPVGRMARPRAHATLGRATRSPACSRAPRDWPRSCSSNSSSAARSISTRRCARYWPEFAAAGKDELPVRYLLTHEAGLSAIGRPMPIGSLSDWDAMVDALAAQEPWWEPGTVHGYHGVTFGHLVGRSRRAGSTVARSARSSTTRSPGRSASTASSACPRPRMSRTATMVLAPIEGATFFSRWGPDSLGPKSFGNPPDCNDPAHTNSRVFRAAEIPAANAHANACARSRVSTRRSAQGKILSPELVHEAGRVARRRARPRHGATDAVRPRASRSRCPRPTSRSGPARGRSATTGRAAPSGSIDPDAKHRVRLRDEPHDVDRPS